MWNMGGEKVVSQTPDGLRRFAQKLREQSDRSARLAQQMEESGLREVSASHIKGVSRWWKSVIGHLSDVQRALDSIGGDPTQLDPP
ncbi:MAG: hypothetical protein ACOY3P_20080 [Planctomycetota bacterium]